MLFPKTIKLAMLPTPVEEWRRIPHVSDDYNIFIKRDDLTGFGLSGNKVRKLEFLAYDAMKKGCDTLITCGGVQSNHARATAIISAQLGLKSHLVLFKEEAPKLDGNLFLDKMTDAKIKYISSEEYKYVDEIMEKLKKDLKRKGQNGYVIPEGGSNALGIWGYIKACLEVKSQIDSLGLRIDKIITAVSSGGTYSGLYIGKKLLNWKVEIIGFNIRETSKVATQRVKNLVQSHKENFKQEFSFKEDEIKVIDGYVGKGYGKSRKIELDLIKSVSKNTGIILDPVYTGKAMLGFVDQINLGNFSKKEKILFLHTGGGFGLFPIKEKFFSRSSIPKGA